MHKRTLFAGAVALILSWSISGGAYAETNDKNIQEARKHMELGQEAFHQKRFEEAARHFDDAFNASPFSAFLYNAGLALERAGNNARALEFYQRYLKIEPNAEDAEMVQEKIDALLAAISAAKSGTGETDTEGAGVVQITETEMKSLISIRTNPKEAQIRIISQAGKEISTSTGPLAQTVEGGTYTIEATHPDYKTVTTDIHVSSGQVYVVVVEMSQGAFLGFLRIVTDPPAAAVFIDDKNLGQAGVAPFSNVLPAGAHHVWIEKPGYLPVEKEVHIDISEEVELNVPLERPDFGALLVKTNADNAVVHVNGLPSGKVDIKTPFRKQLPVGKHRVLVTREGLKDYNAEVEIKGGQETKLLVRLNSKPSRTSGFVSAGFSAALFITGGVLGYFALDIKKELDKERKNGRLASDDDRIIRGFIFGIGADVSFGVGTIIACMSLYYFLRDPLPPSEGKSLAPEDYAINENGTPAAEAEAPPRAPTPPEATPAPASSLRENRPAFLIAPIFGNDTAGLGMVVTF